MNIVGCRLTLTNAVDMRWVCKYVDLKGSASYHAGHQELSRCCARAEVNLKNLLHRGDEACKQGIHSGFEGQGRRHQKWPHKKNICPPKIYIKKVIRTLTLRLLSACFLPCCSSPALVCFYSRGRVSYQYFPFSLPRKLIAQNVDSTCLQAWQNSQTKTSTNRPDPSTHHSPH